MPTNRSDTFDIGGETTVHRLGYGAMRITGEDIIGPPGDEAAARDLLREAGVVEDAVVATKAGLLRDRDGEWLRLGRPEHIRNQVLVSRDRLGVDTIDLYQFHRPDPDVPFEESVVEFAELQDAGLVESLPPAELHAQAGPRDGKARDDDPAREHLIAPGPREEPGGDGADDD
jgi:aryl-alcohol dehydrogenase-like predicted oxidoreductase